MYVVMVKPPDAEVFDPCWELFKDGTYARGFPCRHDAFRWCEEFRAAYGKKNAYVQQYGPIS